MANITGLITVNGKQILEVDAVPSASSGTAAPRGSLAMYDSGSAATLYVKTATVDTGWQEVDLTASDWNLTGNALTGGAADTPNEWLGSSNDFDVIFKRNGSEQFRLQSGAFLIGLQTSLGGRLQVNGAALGDELTKEISPNGGSGSQVIKVTRQYKVQTTNATPTALATLAIPANSRVMARFAIQGYQHGGSTGSAGDGASFIRTIAAKRESGTATLNKTQTDFTDKDVGTFDLSFAASTNDVVGTVTGGANRNIAWHGHAEIHIAQN